LAQDYFNNYATASRSRVKGDKNAGEATFRGLLEKARPSLASTRPRAWTANLNGVAIELVTNSDHQADFWERNWWPATAGMLPDARIYSVTGVEGIEPSAYYCKELHSALFVNTEYYGQCKSWALGIAAAILEQRQNTLSIHGATAMYKGKGVVIIAPTGTGKTTHAFKIFQSPEGKICGDDWAYVKFPDSGVPSGAPLVARQPERSLYMRSESQKEQGWLGEVFDRSMSENVTVKKEDCERLQPRPRQVLLRVRQLTGPRQEGGHPWPGEGRGRGPDQPRRPPEERRPQPRRGDAGPRRCDRRP
jgi:hypothetical protein